VTQRNELERGIHRLRTDVVLGTRSRARLFDGLARENAKWDRHGQRRRELRERPRNGVREDVEMRRLAPDQTAERHHRVETSGAREHRDRRRQLEGARDLELLDPRILGQRSLDGALGKSSRDLVIPARAHDRHASAAMRILNPGRSLPRGRHLPQSSPRMQHRLVNG